MNIAILKKCLYKKDHFHYFFKFININQAKLINFDILSF